MRFKKCHDVPFTLFQFLLSTNSYHAILEPGLQGSSLNTADAVLTEVAASSTHYSITRMQRNVVLCAHLRWAGRGNFSVCMFNISQYVCLTSEFLPNEPFSFQLNFLSLFSIPFCSSKFISVSPDLLNLAKEREITLGFGEIRSKCVIKIFFNV